MTEVVNKYKAPYDVYIGRGSLFGNPFTHLKGKTKAQFQVDARDESVVSYGAWVQSQPEIMRKLPELRGKVLGCFCKPQACHGDVLVSLLYAHSDEELRNWTCSSEDVDCLHE